MRKPIMWFLNRSDANRAVCTSTEDGWLEAGNFGFRKYMNCPIRVRRVAETKAVICAVVFAHAKCSFSHDAAHYMHEFVMFQERKKL